MARRPRSAQHGEKSPNACDTSCGGPPLQRFQRYTSHDVLSTPARAQKAMAQPSRLMTPPALSWPFAGSGTRAAVPAAWSKSQTSCANPDGKPWGLVKPGEIWVAAVNATNCPSPEIDGHWLVASIGVEPFSVETSSAGGDAARMCTLAGTTAAN